MVHQWVAQLTFEMTSPMVTALVWRLELYSSSLMIFIQSRSDSDGAANTPEDVVSHELCRLDADDTVEEMFIQLAMVTYLITCACPQTATMNCIVSFNAMLCYATECHCVSRHIQHASITSLRVRTYVHQDTAKDQRRRTNRSFQNIQIEIAKRIYTSICKTPGQVSSARPGQAEHKLTASRTLG